MRRSVVCVATTREYQKGMARLAASPFLNAPIQCYNSEPHRGPKHKDVPYGFKGVALKEESDHADLLLWADASILPIRSLEPLWERIERDGYWFSKNGWSNYEWTADSAYPDLFPDHYCFTRSDSKAEHDVMAKRVNHGIPHVVATSFGINVKHPKGKKFLDEYYRLASETRAFCGPWINTAHPSATPMRQERWRYGACGPADVRGHRHDQSCASVIAWRLGMVLTDPPDIFAYANRDGSVDPRTILVADGSY